MAEERTPITVRGCTFSTDLSGSGPDLVWGHGLTSSIAAEDEFPLLDHERIRRVCRELRYDARGHGASTSTPVPADLSWERLAHDQLALAMALGIDRYVAAGASMGAATALHAAVLASDRVRGLLLAIPPTAWATRAAQVDRYREIGDLVEQGEHELLLAGAAALPPPDPFVDDPIWASRFADLLATADPVRLARVFRGAATADLPPESAIATIDVPTLILAWTGDAGHPVTTAARLQELMPHAELALATTRGGVDDWTGRVVSWLRSLG